MKLPCLLKRVKTYFYVISLFNIFFFLELKKTSVDTSVRSETCVKNCGGKQNKWNNRLIVPRTIYLNLIIIYKQLVEIYNKHNMLHRIWCRMRHKHR